MRQKMLLLVLFRLLLQLLQLLPQNRLLLVLHPLRLLAAPVLEVQPVLKKTKVVNVIQEAQGQQEAQDQPV